MALCISHALFFSLSTCALPSLACLPAYAITPTMEEGSLRLVLPATTSVYPLWRKKQLKHTNLPHLSSTIFPNILSLLLFPTSLTLPAQAVAPRILLPFYGGRRGGGWAPGMPAPRHGKAQANLFKLMHEAGQTGGMPPPMLGSAQAGTCQALRLKASTISLSLILPFYYPSSFS